MVIISVRHSKIKVTATSVPIPFSQTYHDWQHFFRACLNTTPENWEEWVTETWKVRARTFRRP